MSHIEQTRAFAPGICHVVPHRARHIFCSNGKQARTARKRKALGTASNATTTFQIPACGHHTLNLSTPSPPCKIDVELHVPPFPTPSALSTPHPH
eukprot:scaffold180_cov134-Isochrysis_galbana.AAC.18